MPPIHAALRHFAHGRRWISDLELPLKRSCRRTADTSKKRLVVLPHVDPPPFTKTHTAALVDPADRSGAFAIQSSFHGGDGEVVRHSLLNETSRQGSTLQLWTLAPGASEGMHVHGADGDDQPQLGALEEIYVCLRGSGCVPVRHADGSLEDVRMAPGDAIQIPAGMHHGLRSTGDTELQTLVLWGATAAADQAIVRE